VSTRDREVLRGFARRIDASDAGAHNNLGVLYYTKGLYEEAVEAFTKALDLDPKMQVAQRNLEVAYFNTGYYDSRVAELRERLRHKPDDREARWELGRAFALLGQPEDAIPEFQALLALRPGDVGTMIQLGLAEKAAGRLGVALSWFRTALGRDPQSGLLHFYVGEVLYNQGAFDDALSSLHRAIQLNPDHPDSHFLLSFVLGDMGRHDEAQAASKRAIQLNPALSRAQANLSLDEYDQKKYEQLVPGRQARKSQAQMRIAEGEPLAHYTLGQAFRQQGLLVEASREYDNALARGEDRALVVQAMAELHLLRKEPQPAIALYDELIAERADSPKLWNERGVALHQTGDYAAAASSYGKALEADPTYVIARNNLAVALFHSNQPEESIDEFREALRSHPSFIKARLNLALLLVRGKRFQLALEAYRQVLEHDAEDPLAWNGVGLVLGEMRRFEEARTAYARAIQSRPDYAEAHYNLSFTLSNLGDYAGALRETKRALEIDPYYTPQTFQLAIDLEFEDVDLTVVPDLGGEKRMSGGVETFSFDNSVLDSIFKQLDPVVEPVPVQAHEGDPYSLAEDFLSKGLVDRAMAEVRRAMGRGADPARGDALLGEAFGRQGAWGDALERFEASRRVDPRNTEALRGETQALLMLGRGADAAAPAAILLELLPTDVDALLLVSTARFESGDAEGALTVLDQARRADPTRAEVLRGVGNVLRAMENIDAAISAYRHALTIDGDFAAVRYDLAQLLITRGDFSEAERELMLALDAVPTYADATLSLASLHRQREESGKALALLVEFLERDPYSFDGLVALGELLLEMGRDDDAAFAFQRVLRFDPAHVGAVFHQGLLLSRQQRFREAVACFRRVAELEPHGEFARRAFREARAIAQRVDGLDEEAG
jgi:tetratricopeptide (TPR) repeat protein